MFPNCVVTYIFLLGKWEINYKRHTAYSNRHDNSCVFSNLTPNCARWPFTKIYCRKTVQPVDTEDPAMQNSMERNAVH
jgi:hypothetical protein